ncbi:MAG TPA: hypothetical protein VF980_11765 [Thermoanaerobaculia bacterium]
MQTDTMTALAPSLRAVKVTHTVVWAFFAGCIFAIPVFASLHKIAAATVLIGVVFVECLILAFNGMRCPLTGVAAQFTEDRRDNFDIYLPEWVARYNKLIFGSLYVLGIAVTIAMWLRVQPS